MARTKMTARKSTKGPAPNRQLALKMPAKTQAQRDPYAANKRRRPGELALKEIRQYQTSMQLLIRKVPFARMVREITRDITKCDARYQSTALLALVPSVKDCSRVVSSVYRSLMHSQSCFEKLLATVISARGFRSPLDRTIRRCLPGDDSCSSGDVFPA
jgi:histone H3